MSARDTRATAGAPLGALSKWAIAVWSRPSASISGLFVLLIATLAALAPLIAPTNPYDLATVSILDGRLPPGQEMFDGTVALLGTDGAGRDVLSAILWGLRTSLIVAISSATIALTVGLTVGLAAAFYGGRLDAFLMRVVDIQLSFPEAYLTNLTLMDPHCIVRL